MFEINIPKWVYFVDKYARLILFAHLNQFKRQFIVVIFEIHGLN